MVIKLRRLNDNTYKWYTTGLSSEKFSYAVMMSQGVWIHRIKRDEIVRGVERMALNNHDIAMFGLPTGILLYTDKIKEVV